jgi:hypothetical protein
MSSPTPAIVLQPVNEMNRLATNKSAKEQPIFLMCISLFAMFACFETVVIVNPRAVQSHRGAASKTACH